jgi:hypothetical protein
MNMVKMGWAFNKYENRLSITTHFKVSQTKKQQAAPRDGQEICPLHIMKSFIYTWLTL